MSAEQRYTTGLAELATTMTEQGCVWFVGAGFSIPSKLPGVRELSLTMLRNAVLGSDPLERRRSRYEVIKRALLGNYPTWTVLSQQNDDPGIQREVDQVDLLSQKKPGPERPPWIDSLVHLGRIADVLHRTAGHDRLGERDVELAALMGLDKDADWVKEPSVAHHLLVMLVMEGLVTQIITLNYDDQIERACAQIKIAIEPIRDRFEYRESAGGRGEARPAVFKIHGCRSRYLEARHSDAQNHTAETWETLVERAGALVVTDRQLQHWRDSRWSWAKDLFQDLLRWRPFLFVGFSASDLVLQATLNAVAEEVEGSCGQVFVAPALSFPFYQFLSQMDPGFSPVEPPRVLEAYAQKLLPDLYPEAIAAFFANAIATNPPLDQMKAIALHRHGMADGTIVVAAYAAAVRLLTEAARQVACEGVRVSTPRDPEESQVPDQYIPASTIRRLLHDLQPPGADGGYVPLRKHIEEYRRLAQVLALMLVVNYPDAAVLARLTCSLDPFTENVALLVDDPRGASDRRRVVLVPEHWGQSPTEWLQVWMRTYFEERRRSGLLEEGTHSLIHACWLDREQLRQAVDALDWVDYPGTFQVEIFSVGDYFQAERGKPVV
ncbi:MAG TPA: SIR2 family protein [Symbiobacteriaceae bacterium]|jgi:hypothetical protein